MIVRKSVHVSPTEIADALHEAKESHVFVCEGRWLSRGRWVIGWVIAEAEDLANARPLLRSAMAKLAAQHRVSFDLRRAKKLAR